MTLNWEVFLYFIVVFLLENCSDKDSRRSQVGLEPHAKESYRGNKVCQMSI